MKKLISLLMAVVLLFSISSEAFSAYDGEKVRAYESADCTIVYNITNEWTGNQQVSVSVTNNSDETLRNWALKLDSIGTITNIWNAKVLQNDGELCVIRNNGYNYEIIPGATVEFGFMQQGDSLPLPESISLCSKTADSTACVEVSYEIQNNWGDGFIAAVTVQNISDEPLEAWKLSFNGNFEISSIWNANLLYTEDSSFKVENDITTTPIAAGESKTFGFQGVITSGEEPVMSDFTLTSVVIDAAAAPDDSGEEDDSDETGETTESGDSGETTEPEDPVEPEDPEETEESIILCFGEYLADENALEVYWYSNAEGAVSVYENTNNNGWLKLAEVTDEDSYKYEITEEFLVKYIKVSQETENGTIESEPFIVTLTEDGYVCTWLDTDEDGLPDFVEEMYGTDPEKPDTDDDSLSDYDELYVIGTSPLKYDTDEDGTNDADSDTDGDGLTNEQELDLGTSPSSPDTDGDSLSDYAELYETNTDPLKADTDGDTLSDSDDIALGLDPNNPETFGVPDAKYKVEQTISADSEVMDRINTEEAPYELSLEITASGNAATNLIAGSSIYSTITESSARLGGAVDLSYLSGEVDKVKLVYEVGESYIPNDGSEYAANCVDLQGIKRYNIFRYFEDVNMLLPVSTEFDVENNILYAETDELGTYCVLDMEILLQNLGIAPDGTQTGTVMQEFYSAATVDEGEYYVTFIFDVRKNALGTDLALAKEQVREFAETAYAEGRDVNIRILTQGAFDFISEEATYTAEEIAVCTYTTLDEVNTALSEISTETEDAFFENCYELTDVLGEVVAVSEFGDHNYVFNIYSQTDAIYEQQKADALLENAAENCVDISVITDQYPLEGFQAEMLESSNGTHIVSYYTIADEVYEHVFNDIYVEKEQLPVILATGYQKVILDSKLYPNGYWGGVGTDADTDRDGLTDWDEVKTELLTINGIGDYELPKVIDCYYALDGEPYYVEGALSESKIKSKFWYAEILPINSDPTSVDGDGDELWDIEENCLEDHSLVTESNSSECCLGTDPLSGDTDGDGLWDAEEIYCESDPLQRDTDGDGLSDYFEVTLWFLPNDANYDGDSFNDYEERLNGTSPFAYNLSAGEAIGEFWQGALCGDWEDIDSFEQLIGHISFSFAPLIADGRDYFANILKNQDTGSAILNVGGFTLDFIGIGAAADVAKIVPKLSKFIIKVSDDVAYAIESIIQVTKRFSDIADDIIFGTAKALPAGAFDDIAISIKNGGHITKAEYFKYDDLFEAAGKNLDNVIDDMLGDLDWDAIVSNKGETRIAHIQRHMSPNSARKTHGVFNGNAEEMVNSAWKNRHGIQPIDDGMGGSIYNIPYTNAGYESGTENTGEVLNFITIITKRGTNQLFAAFPSNGTYSR